MSRILRMSDRLKITCGDVEFVVAPLSFGHKREIGSCTKVVNGEEQVDLAEAQYLLLKYGLKDVKGLKDYSGEEYKLEFDGDYLTEDCISELYNCEEKSKFMIAAWQCMNSIPEKIVDPSTNKQLKGVKLEVMSRSGNTS